MKLGRLRPSQFIFQGSGALKQGRVGQDIPQEIDDSGTDQGGIYEKAKQPEKEIEQQQTENFEILEDKEDT